MKKFLFSIMLLTIAFNADAQLFKKIGRAAKKVAKKTAKITKKVGKVAVAPLIAPTKSTINAGKVITRKAPVKSIFTPYTKPIGTAGSLVPNLVKGLTTPQRYMMRLAQKVAYTTGGRYGAFVFDVTTFTNRYYPELSYSLAQNVSAVANGRTPLQIIGAPLAAAIRAARERHYANSQPLPESVKNALRGHIPDATLQKARYAIGNVEITLVNFISHVVYFGDSHAVTVGDLIVFNTDPGSFSQNSNWWAHEVFHVQQYADMGVEKFSFKYMRDFGKSIEKEAERFAESITR